MNYLVGGATDVMAMVSKRCLECETDEITQVIIRFKDGVLGYVGDTYISPSKTFIAVYGTTGRLEFDFQTNSLTYFDIHAKPERIPVEAINLIADEFREFGECIVTGKRPETGGVEGRAAVAVLDAAVRSARTGKAVKI